LDAAIASQLISSLQSLPTILSRGPTKASRVLIAPFKNLADNTYVDGATLSGLIKYQSALTGWDSSHAEDVNYLISMLCAIGPEDWIHLQPARQVIDDQLLRIRDQDILRLWREITDGIDLIDNSGNPPTSPPFDSIHSNYSPDDDVSVRTLDTAPTSSNSATSPYASTPNPLPIQYHYNTPRAPDFNISQSRRLIKSLGKAQKDPAALNTLLDTLRFIRRKGERLLPEALGRLINVAGKAHRVDIVTEAFEFAQNTVREVIPEHEVAFSEWCLILNSMIVANAFNRNFANARHFHSELLKLGVAPDSDAFAAYIVNLNVTDTNDEATEALSIFHEAKSLGVRSSTFLYNTLISKLAKARRSDDALYYFHEMKVNGISPSSVTYGTIINACCRVGNEALALRYFNEMEADQHFVPRIAPYNTMLQFYVQTKQDRADALRFYEKMRAQLLTPSAHTYKLLMDAYATLDPIDIQAAEDILKLIGNDRQRPTSAHYASLIHAYGCVKQDLDSAKAWFHKAIDHSSPLSVSPDETLYQALIEAYVANRRVGDCSTIFKHMEANKIKLTVYMANHLIHGWTIAGNLQEARRIFDLLATEKTGLYGREPSSYEQMTRTYLSMGDRSGALALVEEMKTKGYPAAVVARVTDILEGGDGVGGVLYNGSAQEMESLKTV
jgi:pentatricopeptide repeat protein